MDKSHAIKRNCILTVISMAIAFFAFVTPLCVVADEESEFLSPDKAFKLSVRPIKDEIELKFTIAPGYFLYRKHFHFRNLAEGQPIESIFPPAFIKHDDVLNEDNEVYAKRVKLLIPLIKTKDKSKEHGLQVQYQGCSEGGFCYAPIAKKVLIAANGKVTITELPAEEVIETASAVKPLDHSTPIDQLASVMTSGTELDLDKDQIGSESDFITDRLKTSSFPFILLLFLGFGILLAFTPCVLPMVPIMVNILVGENTPLSGGRATLLASLYVLSVALCYACAGAIAGLTGAQLQVALQQPVFLMLLSFLLILFALNQFNLIHIHLPQIFAHTLHQLQHKQKQGSIIGAIAMGAISALMVSPCITPALVGALTYIGQTGNATLGGFALFAMALGMELPLLIVAAIGSHLLPKSGRWMGSIKIITGIFLLVLAGSLLVRAFPHLFQTEERKTISTRFVPIQNEKELQEALHKAKALQKITILDVSADWCVSCRQLEQELFANRQVLSTLEGVTLLRWDITKQTELNEAFQKNLNIIGPPTLLFFDTTGEENKNYRLVGKINSTNFIQHVEKFLATKNKDYPKVINKINK